MRFFGCGAGEHTHGSGVADPQVTASRLQTRHRCVTSTTSFELSVSMTFQLMRRGGLGGR